MHVGDERKPSKIAFNLFNPHLTDEAFGTKARQHFRYLCEGSIIHRWK